MSLSKGETEVKKDKQWLRDRYESMETIKVTTKNSRGKRSTSYLKKKTVINLLNQLDEPEVLSQKWIDEHVVYADVRGGTQAFIHVDDLQNLFVPTLSEMETDERTHLETAYKDILDRGEFWFDDKQYKVVEKINPKITLDQAWEIIKGKYGDGVLQNNIDYVEHNRHVVIEKPTIPRFVAEYLDFAKSDTTLMRVLELANTRNELEIWEKEYDWISANDETFARAWLDGYEVEEEQKYYVLNNEKYFLLGKDKGHGFIFSTGGNYKLGSVERTSATFELTEQEIKDYDERYWPFAVKVEEMEE